MLITDASIARRTTVFVLMLIILVVGLFSYVTLPRESNPDITIPYILVQTTYKGAASEDVENLITIPIERSEEHTSELQSHSFISYAVSCLNKKKTNKTFTRRPAGYRVCLGYS